MSQISKAQIEQVIELTNTAATSKDADFSNEDAVAELLAIFQRLLDQPEGEPVNNAFLTTPEVSALTRFCETCEDGEGYDVPKSMMQRLAQIGVIRHLSRGIYEITEFGRSVVDINGETETFKAGATDDDYRFGCLSFGFYKTKG